MSTVLPFGSNTLTTYVYEPFSYTISNPSPGTYTLTTSNTPGIPPGYLVNNNSNVVFSTSSNTMAIGTEGFTVTANDASGNTVSTSSNVVNIKAGRFTDGSGNDYTGSNYTFYKNEPIPPIPLVAPFAISVPTSVPTLPPGLGYVSNASNIYSIAGTPLVTVPQSNYLFIGKGTGTNLGKVVTSRFGIAISNERLLLNLSGTPIVSPMTVGSAITPRVLTAAFPPYPSGGSLRYTWSGLPDGIVITDLSGTTQPGMFMPTDPSYTLIVTGTPSLAAANAFRDAGITSNVVTINATRTAPLPQISNSVGIAFAFGETVLFDTTVVPPLYNGVALDPAATYYRAQTYFSSGPGIGISNMFSPNLRSDLSLNFVSAQGRAYLTGTPTTPIGTNTYTIRAINSNGITRDLSSSITVANDTVSFVSPPTPIDVCYNFVLSRPSSLALTGYYPSNIQFQATAASGKPVSFSAPGLAGTGLSLSNVSANVVQIVGTPDTVTALKNVSVVASAIGTPATATRDISLAVINDVITVSDVSASSLAFVQNVPITPIQLSATTLSERSVISYTSTSLPGGLSVSTTGLITGTPTADTSGTFTINASTGYANQNKTYTYALTPDSILFLVDPTSYTYAPSATVSIDIDGLSYSGNALTNYGFNVPTPYYGLSIDSSSGVISGTLIDNVPPNVFPPSASFGVTAQTGLLTGTLATSLTTTNPLRYVSFRLYYSSEAPSGDIETGIGINNANQLEAVPASVLDLPVGGESIEFVVKNDSADSNVFISVLPASGSLLRSTTGTSFTQQGVSFATYPNFKPSYIANKPNTSTWWLSGYSDASGLAVLAKSVDDGASWSLANTSTIPSVYSRNSNGTALGASTTNAYVLGLPLRYKDGVLLVSGLGAGARSTNEGSNWSPVTIFSSETGAFSLDAPSIWVAAGSDLYKTYDAYSTYTSATNTIKYSSNQGQTWSNVSGGFNFFGYEVAYASNTWLATGVSYRTTPPSGYYYELRTSTDGSNWNLVDLSANYVFGMPEGAPPTPQLPLGSMMFDGSNWNVFVRRNNGFTDVTEIYKHDLSSSLTSNWQSTTAQTESNVAYNVRYPRVTPPVYIRLGTPTTVTFSFNTLPAGGPVLTSPTSTSFTFYQYATISPITFSAMATGTLYYFVESGSLPRGISFDILTGTLSGTSVELGQRSFILYLKDSVGVTRVTVNTTTIIPNIVRQQTSAGAWTSLVRQYTVVNAAQNSVNGRALPATEPPLGEFMRPEPPDSVSAPGNPNCKC